MTLPVRLALAAGLALPATLAVAQPVAPPPPPPGTLSTTRESHAVDAYGNETNSRSTSYRDSTGNATDSTTTTTAAPPPPPPTTSTTTTTTRTTEPN